MNKKRKPRYKKWIILIVVVGVIALVATKALTPKVIAYESVLAKTSDLATYYSFSGNIEAKNREIVLAERLSQIDDLLVAEGEMVEEGQDVINPSSGDNLKAGVTGEISKIFVNLNDQVNPGTKLVEIVDYANLQVSVKVDEYELPAVEVGKEVTVNVNSLDKEIKGTIESVSKEGEVMNGVTYFIAIIDLEADDSLKIGMSTEITLVNSQVLGALTLPMTAIQFEEDNSPFVFLEGQEKEAVKTIIETGVNDGTNVEITSGVKNGDKVLYNAKVAERTFTPGFGGGNGGAESSPETDGGN